MSYDMQIGREEYNYTWNVAPMWYDAIPDKGIRVIYDLTGREALEHLRHIRAHMEDNRDEMLKMEPPNGWGDYEDAWGFINELIMASIRNPHEVWIGG